MSHHIYHTEGFILGSTAFGEANRHFKILTKDFGLIQASAQGVRFLKSKLRYSLQDFSFCELSVVRGREFWRITGASKKFNLREASGISTEASLVFVRVFALLGRLLRGEEKNLELYSHIESAAFFLRNDNLSSRLSSNLIRNFEYVLVLRILSRLGYLGISPDSLAFVESLHWNEELLIRMSRAVPMVIREINNSLKAADL